MLRKAHTAQLALALLPLLACACVAFPQEPSAPPPAAPPRVTVNTPPPAAAMPPRAGVTPAAPVTAQPAAPATAMGSGIALLLPLSGQFSATAEAVRDGFMSQYFADGAHPPLKLYDVGTTADGARAAYARALAEGAGVVVGPLTREGVASLAGLNSTVPVLGLNYLDANTALSGRFYQFGLAPEDEARAAARLALAQNQRRALALVPDSEWGSRTLAAFDAALRAGGGQVLRVQRYAQGVNDQSKLIAELMGVADSEERHRAMTLVLGAKSEFESQRRGDVDLVFLGARAQDARLLVPQLRFNRAGDLPIYTTALVYDGQSNADLAGLRFCDQPWMIETGEARAAQRNAVASLPSAKASPRLFALGRDAYALSTGLLHGSLRVGDGLDGASGRLEWQDRSVIGRQLDCVQMAADGLRPLNP